MIPAGPRLKITATVQPSDFTVGDSGCPQRCYLREIVGTPRESVVWTGHELRFPDFWLVLLLFMHLFNLFILLFFFPLPFIPPILSSTFPVPPQSSHCCPCLPVFSLFFFFFARSHPSTTPAPTAVCLLSMSLFLFCCLVQFLPYQLSSRYWTNGHPVSLCSVSSCKK